MESYIKNRLPVIMIFMNLFVSHINAQELLHRLNDVQWMVENKKYSKALAFMDSISNDIDTVNDILKSRFYKMRGTVMFELHDYVCAVKSLDSALIINRRSRVSDVFDDSELYLLLGVSHHRMENYRKAERYYRRGLLEMMNSVRASSFYRSSFYFNLGLLYRKQGDSIVARECFERVDTGKNSVWMDAECESYRWMGQAIDKMKEGEYQQSLLLCDSLISRMKETVGVNNHFYVQVISLKGAVLYEIGGNKCAKEMYQELFNIREKIQGYVNSTSKCKIT